jgi:hypothetical protein
MQPIPFQSASANNYLGQLVPAPSNGPLQGLSIQKAKEIKNEIQKQIVYLLSRLILLWNFIAR